MNIEMHWLHTFIRDDRLLHDHHICRLHDTDPLLVAEMQDISDWKSRVNVAHTHRLDSIEALTGFTGIRGPGTRRGAMVLDAEIVPSAHRADDMVNRSTVSLAERAAGLFIGENGDVGGDGESDEDAELEEQMTKLSEAIAVEPSTGGIPNSMLNQWVV